MATIIRVKSGYKAFIRRKEINGSRSRIFKSKKEAGLWSNQVESSYDVTGIYSSATT